MPEQALTAPQQVVAETIARAAIDMARAHERHQPNKQRPDLYSCSGISDPLTGHWCQFYGTSQDQHAHLIERVSEAVRAALTEAGTAPLEYRVVRTDIGVACTHPSYSAFKPGAEGTFDTPEAAEAYARDLREHANPDWLRHHDFAVERRPAPAPWADAR